MKTRYLPLLVLFLIFASCAGNDAADLLRQAQDLEDEGKNKEALVLFERITTEYQDADEAPEAMFHCAALYRSEQNDAVKSVSAYELIAERYPDSEYAHKSLFVAGFIYANEMNNLPKAKQAYQRYMELYPDSSMAESATTELDNLGKSPDELLEMLRSQQASEAGGDADTEASSE